MDGELLTWGCASLGDSLSRPCYEPTAVPTSAPVRQLDATTRHACFVATDDRTYCVGEGSQGQMGDGGTQGRLRATTPVAGNHLFSQVSAGGSHSCAVEDETRIVYCWGENIWMQLGAPTVQDGSAVPIPVAPVL